MLVLKGDGYGRERPLRGGQPDMLRDTAYGAPASSHDADLWHRLGERDEAHIAAATQWVLSSKAAWEAHGAGSLAGHLAATATWLNAWGADKDIIMGGLCHALFGTAIYGRKAFDLDNDRNMMEQIFGQQGLRLGVLMGASDRRWINELAAETERGNAGGWPKPIRTAANMAGTRYVEGIQIQSEEEWRAIMLITTANECAQLGRWDRIETSLGTAVSPDECTAQDLTSYT